MQALFLAYWNCSNIRLWCRLHNSVNIWKTVQFIQVNFTIYKLYHDKVNNNRQQGGFGLRVIICWPPVYNICSLPRSPWIQFLPFLFPALLPFSVWTVYSQLILDACPWAMELLCHGHSVDPDALAGFHPRLTNNCQVGDWQPPTFLPWDRIAWDTTSLCGSSYPQDPFPEMIALLGFLLSLFQLPHSFSKFLNNALHMNPYLRVSFWGLSQGNSEEMNLSYHLKD